MAVEPRVYWRNYDSSDSTMAMVDTTKDVIKSIETVGFAVKPGCVFKEWSNTSDGTGSHLQPGGSDPNYSPGLYAIWEVAAPTVTDYIASSTDLTSVADAIRVKAEISGTLEFPSGFITAINSITGGGMTITRTPDSAGGEVLNISGTATEVESLSVTANGTYTAPSGKAYTPISVNVPTGITPTGTKQISITQNGTTTEDVTSYASAQIAVNVPAGITPTGTINITENGTVDVTNYASANVNVSGGGASVVEEKDVNFYDYDGTCVASYTAAEFANLSALPANPSHNGLTAQGWNWTLSDAKTHVATYGVLDIGQMYDTESGGTEFDIVLEESRLSPCLNLAVNGSLTIFWGDGASDSISGSSITTAIGTSHNYLSAGSYTILIKSQNNASYALIGSSSTPVLSKAGETAIANNRIYAAAIKRVRLGTYASVNSYAFLYCTGLETITLPTSGGVNTHTFEHCHSLKHITFRSNTLVPTYCFSYCAGLRTVSMPKTLTSVDGYGFYNCYSLKRITVPIYTSGTSTFGYCYSLEFAFVTRLNSTEFSSAYGLRRLTILGSYATIGASTCYNCSALSRIDIPSWISTISSSAFQYCTGLGEIHFKGTTPPTVQDSYVFGNVPTDCKIYVPTGKLSAYTSANNYPSSSTYTYIEE